MGAPQNSAKFRFMTDLVLFSIHQGQYELNMSEYRKKIGLRFIRRGTNSFYFICYEQCQSGIISLPSYVHINIGHL